jgi:hypothetical protein
VPSDSTRAPLIAGFDYATIAPLMPDSPDRTSTSATFRIHGSAGHCDAASHEEQPRERPALAWLRLSGTGSVTAGGVAAALVLQHPGPG